MLCLCRLIYSSFRVRVAGACGIGRPQGQGTGMSGGWYVAKDIARLHRKRQVPPLLARVLFIGTKALKKLEAF